MINKKKAARPTKQWPITPACRIRELQLMRGALSIRVGRSLKGVYPMKKYLIAAGLIVSFATPALADEI